MSAAEDRTPQGSAAVGAVAAGEPECDGIVDAVTAALTRSLNAVDDPCMVAAGSPASIIDLGLVDSVEVEGRTAKVAITLTEPGCPFTHHIIAGIHDAAAEIDGIDEIEVTPVWSPLWTEARLAPRGREALADARGRMRGELPLFRQPHADAA